MRVLSQTAVNNTHQELISKSTTDSQVERPSVTCLSYESPPQIPLPSPSRGRKSLVNARPAVIRKKWYNAVQSYLLSSANLVPDVRYVISITLATRRGGGGEEGPTTLRLTRTRFRLKTQLFRHGYGFCPHASHENDHWKRNFSKSSQEWNILTTLFSRVRMDGRNRNFSRMWHHTISANRPCAMLQTYSRWRAGASLSCLYDFSLFHI